jgi:predicted amidophosphoribosyltransferase
MDFERGDAHDRLLACPVCGLDLSGEPGRCPNRWCGRTDRCFSVVFPVAAHSGALRHALLRYKYKRELWWARVFAHNIAGHLRSHETWFEEFDLIAGVPSYTGPESRRGWDPVGGILAELGPIVQPAWRIATGLIVKTTETRPMQGLSGSRRRGHAEGPLRRSLSVPQPSLAAGARVLLFDDVMTEGSTLREAARALRGAGASEVAGLVLARLPWTDQPRV